MTANKHSSQALTLAAIGVVYGDIGTSPLYTLKECFAAEHLEVSLDNVLGFLSLIFWAIMLVVTLKYIIFVLNANSKGEGGIVVLMQEAKRHLKGKPAWLIMIVGLIGAALFYGDVVITPAISVLSATEGLVILNENFEQYVLPFAMGILILLFVCQKFGTQKIGNLFGPIMVLWFLCLATLGSYQIIKHPQVLYAVNPYFAFKFIANHGANILLVLGAVVLALTGAEALYADMGHFGKQPIRLAWFSLILPSLLLNYFGQGALLLSQPEAVKNPFFLLAPSWGLFPLILLATCATIIASQAVISGAYSITRQVIQLGFSPKMKIVHTSDKEIGQIYIPAVNWLLFFAVIIVMGVFRSSSNLAAAYGISVTATMVLTSILFCIVMIKNWHWPTYLALLITGLFLSFDLTLFIANLLKLFHGGWLPVFLAIVILLIFLTWVKGRALMSHQLNAKNIKLSSLLHNLEAFPEMQTVSGSAIFMSSDEHSVPAAFLHNLKHNKILHEKVAFLTIQTKDEAFVEKNEKIVIKSISSRFTQVIVYYGYQEIPNIQTILTLMNKKGLAFEIMDTSFFLSRDTITSSGSYRHIGTLRGSLFNWLNKNSARTTDFIQIPANRVIELGVYIEI